MASATPKRWRWVLGGGAVLRLQELHAQGLSLRAIARHTGYDRKTIRKWLKVGGIPHYRPRPCSDTLVVGGGQHQHETLMWRSALPAPVLNRRPLAVLSFSAAS